MTQWTEVEVTAFYRGANEPLMTKPDKRVALADTTNFRRHAVQLFSPNKRLTDNFITTVRHQVGEILRISCLHEIRYTKAPQTKTKTKLNSVALVRERTIPTERPPPVGEVSANFLRIEGCHVVIATDPHGRLISVF